MIIQAQYRLIVLAIFFFTSLSISAQRNRIKETYNEEMIVVSNYTDLNSGAPETRSINNLLQAGVKGFVFHLAIPQDSTQIYYIAPNQKIRRFTEVLTIINNYLVDHPTKCLTLFLNYNFKSKGLVQILKSHNLYDKIWEQAPNDKWLGTEEMASLDKQLICFSMRKHDDLPAPIGYMWNYMVEPFFSTNVAPQFHGSYYRGKSENQLMFFNGFNLPKDTTGLIIPWQNMNINSNSNPYFISHAINLWKKTGKRPNFIVLNKFDPGVFSVIYNLHIHKTVSGTITFNRTPLSMVRWHDENNSITSGDFSFPLVEGESIILRPQKPGFSFIPKEVDIKNVKQDIIQNFIAIPHKIDKQLVAYYPFDKNCKDISLNRHNGEIDEPKFVNDLERGWSIELKDEQFITLPTAEEMKIRDQDFTVSAWIKPKDFKYRDLTILGTEENYYRKGLHLQLRNKQPYFGFYANDLVGSTIFKDDKWYHIVWRYTKFNGEQAIFVNGKADGNSLKHPAFMGLGNLMIGKSINMKNYFIGRIDDLCIWNRPLGDEEIWNLYQEVTPITTDSFLSVIKRNSSRIIIVVILILVLVAFIFRNRIKQVINPKVQAQLRNVVFKTKPLPQTNAISLFGDFQVIASNGEDITEKFTPKVRQLFLLILFYTHKEKKGISSELLTTTLWPDLPRKSAVNNRGVNISKLRSLLAKLDTIEIKNKEEHWQMKFSENVFCDYSECLRILETHAEIEDINVFGQFFTVVEKGSLLRNCEYDWIDEFKGFIANEIIDMLQKMLDRIDIKSSPNTTIQLANRILKADMLNEQALAYKIKALMAQNNYNMAKYTYQKFSDLYQESYNEPYDKSFGSLQS